MAHILQIAHLGQPVLREKAAPVGEAAAVELGALIEDMLVTLEDANGVGLAAPQVYESKCLFALAPRPSARHSFAPLFVPLVAINPEITWFSDDTDKDWEGCLSIPGIRGLVPRARRIRIRYTTVDGALAEEEMSDFAARVFQHEIDHLEGSVFLDRVETTREIVTEKEYQRIISR